MTVPSEPMPVPEVVAGIAAGRPVVAVWVNELGGVTFQVGSGSAREFVKVSPPDWAHHVVAERDRLHWAAAFAQVPRVLGAGGLPTLVERRRCLLPLSLAGRNIQRKGH